MDSVAGLFEEFAIFALLVALVAAALSDARTYLIPNRYAAAIVAAFPFFAFGKPLDVWLFGLLAGVLLLSAGTALFARRLLGGGDVKLLAAIGLWSGFAQLPLLLMGTALAGGALAIAYLSPLHNLLPLRSGSAAVSGDLRSRLQEPIPFGIAIAFGGMCVALSLSIS